MTGQWHFSMTCLALVTACSGLVSAARGDALAGTKVKVPPVVPLKALAFPLADMRSYWGWSRVLGTMNFNLGRLGNGDPSPDRLLHDFRLNAGLPSPAWPLGGWEDPRCELRGHFVGHYLSACGLMYATSGGAKKTGEMIVQGLVECQARLKGGYLSAFPEEFFDRLEAGKPVCAPYYTLHKIMAGLLDMYLYCDNRQALDACKKLADWVIARNARFSDEQMQKILEVEHGGMSEVLANLYGVTGEAKYLTIAQRFNHWAVLGPASRREDRLTGLHANTQIPKFIGAARQYELTGDERLKTAATFFWDTVVKERSYVTGGNSDGEVFTPKEKLSEALSPATCESCSTYNMLKLTRHLVCWEPKPEYLDYYERALFNHILASFNPKDGMTCCYLPLAPASKKVYCTPYDSFWCCMGTGLESFAKHSENVYFHDGGKGLYLALFIAAEDLHWKAKGVVLRQQTNFPDEENTRLQFMQCTQPVELTLYVRHPGWATAGMTIKVNGQPQAVSSTPGSFAPITRTWKTDDRIEISTPFVLHTEAFRDNPRRLAILHGPLVLAAEVDPARPIPVLVADEGRLLASLKRMEGKSSTFTAPAGLFRIAGDKTDVEVTLEPFWKMFCDRPYTIYWYRRTPAEWLSEKGETGPLSHSGRGAFRTASEWPAKEER
jgi:DUF1680 family protein